MSSIKCAHCKEKDGTEMCGRCRNTRYCGRECQKAAWNEHKVNCAPFVIKTLKSGMGEVTLCNGCYKKEGHTKCGRCKAVRYCGAECQRAAWKTHKKDCDRYVESCKDTNREEAQEDAKMMAQLAEQMGVQFAFSPCFKRLMGL